MTGVEITSDPGAGDLYGIGESVEVSVTFNAQLDVTGTPRLKIRLAQGSGERWADYHSGTGSNTLVFRYNPAASDASTDGVAVVANSLELNSGTITASRHTASETGSDADLGHTGLAHDSEHLVETTAPTRTAAVINGKSVILTYGEDLFVFSLPHQNQFTFSIDGVNKKITHAAIFETAVLVIVSEEPTFGQTAKLTYTYDSTNSTHSPIRDIAGNNAATFTGTSAVTLTKVSNPTFDDGAAKTLSIDENNDDAASVGTVAATDGDGDTLTYSLTGADADTFTISSSGEIEVASGITLSHETQSSYSVTAQVTDGEELDGQTQETATIDDTITVTINVNDVAEPPGAPTGLSVTGQSSSSLTLGWTAPSAGTGPALSGYQVRYYQGTSDPADAADWIEPGETGGHTHSGTATTSTIMGLSANTSYRVQVRAANDEGNSAWTSSVGGATSNEPAINLSVSPTSADEDDGTVRLTLSATRDATDATDAVSVAVTIGTAASTATHGQNCPTTDGCDWGGSTTATVNFGANRTSSFVVRTDVVIKDDDLSEGNETIVLGGTASGFSVTPATFTINDDDAPATSVTVTVSPTELTEAAGKTTATVTATLDGGTLASDLTVRFHALGGTATGGGDDYTSTVAGGTDAKTTPDAVTISTGSLSASTTIDIDPEQDNVDEGAGETIVFDATLSGALSGTGTGKVTPATLTIDDNDDASTIIRLSVNPSSVDEGDSETGITVTATLAGSATYPDDQTVSVQVVSVASGGATPGTDASTGDYRVRDFSDVMLTDVTLPISLGSITIPAESSTASATFKVTPNDDSTSEGTETIRVDGTLTGFTVNHADISFTDNDLPPLTLSSTTTSIAENASPTRVTVTATVGQNVSSAVSLPLTFAGGATKGTDYTITNPPAPTITISSGQKTGSVTFTLTPDDDRVTETGGETIVIGASHDDYSVSSHSITMTDNDVASDAVILKLSHTELLETAANTVVTVTAELNKGTLGSDVEVTFDALSGPADRGANATSGDYTSNPAKPAAITIPAGSLAAQTTISINPRDDNIDEGTGENISFTAMLSGGLSGSATAKTLRITDNDRAFTTIQLTTSPTKVSEGHSGEATVTVTARGLGTKTHNSDTTVPVRVIAVTGAKRGATPSASSSSGDYTLKNFAGTAVSDVTLPISLGSITIPAASLEASATFKIDPRDDSDFEGTHSDAHEYIRIAAGTVSGELTVVGLDLELTENDNPTMTFTVDADKTTSGKQDSVPEAAGTRNLSVTMTLDQGARSTSTPVMITYGGTATRGTCQTNGTGPDYSASTRTVTIPANNSSHTFDLPITVCDDLVTETTDETIKINGSASGFDVTGTEITIIDNDAESTALTIIASPSPLAETDGSRTVTVTARLAGGTVGAAVNVTFDALSGGADRGADTTSGDYTSNPAKPAAITIPAGSLAAQTTISIDPRDDSIDEDDETIVFDASATRADTSATLTVTEGTVTITDNDTAAVDLKVDTDTGTSGDQTAIGESDSATTVRVKATLSLVRSTDTELTLNIAGGTAERTGDRKDYDPSSSLTDTTVDITITAGSTTGSADVTITPKPDRFDENNETIVIGAAASDSLVVDNATVTLNDDDSPSTTVTLTVDTDPPPDGMAGNQTSIAEGGGAKTVLVTAELNDAVRSTATEVTLTFGGSAGAPGATGQYNTSGTLAVIIGADEVSGQQTITITPDDEKVDDGDKTIEIGGTAPAGSNLNVTAAPDITLSDNDDPPTLIKLTVNPATVREQGPAGDNLDCPEGVTTPGAGCITSVTITASFTGDHSDVTLVQATPVTLSVHGDSSTVRGTDYTAPATLGDTGNNAADITIPIGQKSASTTVEFTSLQDDVNENAENIIITGSATGFTIAGNDRATIVFSDDDSPSKSLTLSFAKCTWGQDPHNPVLTCEKSGVKQLTEWGSSADGVGLFQVKAELDGSTHISDVNVTLRILSADEIPEHQINATLGRIDGVPGDYTVSDNLSDTTVDITIPATQKSATTTEANVIQLRPREDRVDDDGEVIVIGADVDLASITKVNPWTITIIDREEASTSIAITKSSGLDSFTEDHGSTESYQVVATLAGDIARSDDTTVTVTFEGGATLGASCDTAGVDYTASPAAPTITIAAETLTGQVQVDLTPCDDEETEQSKTIEIRGTADYGTVDSGFDVRLDDDDLPIITLSTERVSPVGSDNSLREGTSATFRITASRETTLTTQRVVLPLEVLTTSTATSPDDYQLSLGSITIRENEASATRNVTLRTRQDQLVEGDETVVVGGRVGDGSEFAVLPVTLTIDDDDVASKRIDLSVSRQSLHERAGRTRVTVTAELDGAPVAEGDVVVTLTSPLGGTATVCEEPTEALCEGKDYILGSPGPVTITIPTGRTRANAHIDIDPVQDDIDEGDSETINVSGTVTSTAGSGLDRDGDQHRDHRRRHRVDGHRPERGHRPGRGRPPDRDRRGRRQRAGHRDRQAAGDQEPRRGHRGDRRLDAGGHRDGRGHRLRGPDAAGEHHHPRRRARGQRSRLHPHRHQRLGPGGLRDDRALRRRHGLHGVGRRARHRRRRRRRRRRLPRPARPGPAGRAGAAVRRHQRQAELARSRQPARPRQGPARRLPGPASQRQQPGVGRGHPRRGEPEPLHHHRPRPRRSHRPASRSQRGLRVARHRLRRRPACPRRRGRTRGRRQRRQHRHRALRLQCDAVRAQGAAPAASPVHGRLPRRWRWRWRWRASARDGGSVA